MAQPATASITLNNPAHRLVLTAVVCGCIAWLAGPTGRLLVLLPLLLFGPGYLLARGFALDLPLPLFTRPALWLGLSFSSITIIYLWVWAVGLALSTPLLGGLCLALAIAVALSAATTPPQLHTLQPERWYGLGLLAVFALTLLTRFSQIRDLALPVWVDSVHHTLLVRIVAETGSIPISLQPYLPVDDLPYHWGYHVVIGALLQLSGMQLPQLILWSGQILNALCVVVVAGLAAMLWRSRLATLVAAIVAGLLSNMPAYYLSWGRYTQLSGLLVLPPLAMLSLLAWQSHFEHTKRLHTRNLLACLGIMIAGLILIHYRVLIFWLPLLGLMALVYAGAATTRPYGGWLRRVAVYAVLPSLLGGALALPWIIFLLRRILLRLIAQPERALGSESYNSLNLALLWTGNTRWLYALAGLAALAALWQRRRAALLIVGWVTALMIMANPRAIGLPPLWIISNDSVLIMLFLPASLLLGGGASLLATWWAYTAPNRLRPLLAPALVLSLATAAGFGAWQLRDIINPTTVLATQADVEAIGWAEQHTPSAARFLVSARPWLASVDRGGDGGWWLMPLAGRWTSTPPVLYTYGPSDEYRAIFARTQAIGKLKTDSVAELERLIRENQIDYIYTSGGDGSIPAALLARMPGLEPVYHNGSVIIYRVASR